MSGTTDAAAFDTSIWRVVGDPLVRPEGSGVLDGHRVAVKDLFAVAGQPVGAGNPTWLAAAPVQDTHAGVVRELLSAGAAVAGIARTDEFAYSLAGANVHYGTPANIAAVGRISGGSSSGSATAVSCGQASIGLGTDTGGSIRVPAAYQGLFGIRTTHRAISRKGLLPLAPSFDTVGWLTRDATALRAVGKVLLPGGASSPSAELVAPSALRGRADDDVAAAVDEFCAAHGVVDDDDPFGELDAWVATFVLRQSVEAWQSHGHWLASRLDSLGADVRARFELARSRTAQDDARSQDAAAAAREAIRTLVGDRILMLPAASGVAPRIGADLAGVRDATLALTCLAGLGGLPSVCVPLRTAEGLPCAVALLGAPGRDLDLLDLAVTLAP